MNIELTEYQAKVLWTACNAAQSQGVHFLIQYETGMLNSSELKQWYKEGKDEYNALQAIKDQLRWTEHE